MNANRIAMFLITLYIWVLLGVVGALLVVVLSGCQKAKFHSVNEQQTEIIDVLPPTLPPIPPTTQPCDLDEDHDHHDHDTNGHCKHRKNHHRHGHTKHGRCLKNDI